MPGVSTSRICAAPSIAMPISRARVVCAFGLTIATFWPTSALTSVDLPALGAPITATKPARDCFPSDSGEGIEGWGRSVIPPPPPPPPGGGGWGA